MGYTPRSTTVYCKSCDFYKKNFWTSREICRISIEETNHFGVINNGFVESNPSKKNSNNDCNDHREYNITPYYYEGGNF